MKESYGEGLATHTDPESCGAACEGGVEALTGARAGRVFSRESPFLRGADAVRRSGRLHSARRYRETRRDSSRTNSGSRQVRVGLAVICGMRWSIARWKSSFSMTPRIRARPGFIPTGKFSASTFPLSSRESIGASGFGSPAGGSSV
jgi:hypothetical protein